MKQIVSFQLDSTIVAQLKAKAVEQMITPSALLRIILVKYLADEKAKAAQVQDSGER